MIKLNTPYHVAEENVSVTFTEVKNGTITGTYNNSTLTGTLEGNFLSATFHNSKVNAVGLIELTFNENGFEGKWKKGLEPGPMRGKWNGKLSDSGNNTKKDDSSSLSAEQLKWIEKKDSWDYEEAPKEWLHSKEFILNAVKKDENTLEFASDELKNDLEIVKTAVLKNGWALQYASDSCKDDKEVVLAALSNDGTALEFASDHLKDDEGVVLAAIAQDGRAIEYASANLMNKKSLFLIAVSSDSRVLKFAIDILKNDKEILAAAIKNDDSLSYLLNENLTDEQKEYLEEGVSIEDFDAENHGDDDEKVEWMKEKAFLMEAVKQDVRILKHASDELKADRELVMEAIKNGIDAIDYADENLQWDPEILTLRIDTYFRGDNNINISNNDLTIFLTDNSNPSILIEKLLFKVEFLFLKNKKEEVKVFHKELIDFINANHECYWILAAVSERTLSIYNKFDNYSYSGDANAKSKFEEIAELEKLIKYDIDFQPEIEFETYFIDSEISQNWDAGKWATEEDDEGLSFTEFIMSETDMEWDTDSWDDAKYYNHAISRFWIALQNYSYSNDDEENMAVCLYSVVQEQYEPIQDSGCADFGINTFRTVIEFIFGMKRNDYDLNETDRDDLEEFNGWQFDLNKVASELCNSDLFDDWPGASEFAKNL